jgi:hypothetical protein
LLEIGHYENEIKIALNFDDLRAILWTLAKIALKIKYYDNKDADREVSEVSEVR